MTFENSFDDRRERRRQKRLEKLGTNNPICPGCGEEDWRCFEEHHVAGRKYDAETHAFCANCHKKLSDDQYAHPPVSEPTDFLAKFGRYLLGVGELLKLLAARLIEFGKELIARSNVNCAKESD